jgi:hypothetical protein
MALESGIEKLLNVPFTGLTCSNLRDLNELGRASILLGDCGCGSGRIG